MQNLLDKGIKMGIEIGIFPEFHKRSALSPIEDAEHEVLGIISPGKSYAENFISYFSIKCFCIDNHHMTGGVSRNMEFRMDG